MNVLKYLDAFIDEANENVRALNHYMLELTQASGTSAILNGMFRSSHSVKASSQTMGFDNTARLTHEMENIISYVWEKGVAPDGLIYDLLRLCIERIEHYLTNISKYGNEGPSSADELIAEIEGALGKTAEKTYYIRLAVSDECLMKAARAYLAIRAIEKSGAVIAAEPSVDDIKNERFDSELTLTLLTVYDAAHISDVIKALPEIRLIDIRESAPERRGGGAAAQPVEIPGRTIRIGVSQLNALQEQAARLIDETSRLTALLPQPPAEDIEASAIRVKNTAGAFLADVKRLRMTPLSDVFDRLPGIFSDLTEKLGKKAELSIAGGDVKCDVNLVSGLTQPLIHILRNCVDHGVEASAARLAAGKPETGRVAVSAEIAGDDLVIVVEDDGAGVDVERTRAKAVKAGILSEGEAERLTKAEVVGLIFQPLLSTREHVSMYSGRGVGMDIVNAKTAELGGEVSVDSEEGRGTKIKIKLPMTSIVEKGIDTYE